MDTQKMSMAPMQKYTRTEGVPYFSERWSLSGTELHNRYSVYYENIINFFFLRDTLNYSYPPPNKKESVEVGWRDVSVV